MVPKSSPGPLRSGKRASQRLRENSQDLPRAPNMVPKALEGGPRSLWDDLRGPFGFILAPISTSGTSFGRHSGSYSDLLDAFPQHFSANTTGALWTQFLAYFGATSPRFSTPLPLLTVFDMWVGGMRRSLLNNTKHVSIFIVIISVLNTKIIFKTV